MKHTLLFTGSLILSMVLLQCDIINPEEPIPGYIHIKPFTLSTNALEQGSADHNISEGWVFADGVFLGVYDLPAEVPVLSEGEVEIRIEAGIQDNGISTTLEIYPFYTAHSETLTLGPNTTDTIRPAITYLPEAKFSFIEDFETARPRIFTLDQIGETNMELSQEDVFEGDYVGKITLKRDSVPIIEIATGPEFADLMVDGVYVYLEINYKSDAPVLWGISGITDPVSGVERYIDVGFAPKSTWNKIYFNLSPTIHNSQLDNYRITLQALLSTDSPDVSEVYLDNIKLVHF